MATTVTNMDALLTDLSKVYGALRDASIDLAQAKEVANVAGKIIKGCAVQINYNQYMKLSTPIPFLNASSQN